ncbi:DPBB and LysM peptidoglycan-binding domain-containing protein [Mucilaginibacter sp.]
MKLNSLLIIIPSIIWCAGALAAPVTDSVSVENLDGKKLILHKLDPKDNYYSIGRRYNVKPAAIIQYNNNALLHVGQIIKVPTDVSFLQSSAPPPEAASTPGRHLPTHIVYRPGQQAEPGQNTAPGETQQYKVSPGETLFAIAKRFNTTVDELIRLNDLKSNNLVPGRILLVPTEAATSVQPPPVNTAQTHANEVAVRDTTNVAVTDSSGTERRYPANRYGLFEKNEKGVATWMDDAGFDPNKKLVLHRTAPIGTIIKITNPMTSRTVFAKVVGRFTDNANTHDVVVVMTKNAAESIGALDKRFRVNISYGIPE